MTLGENISGADFSPDRVYRRLLWRIWDVSDPLLLMIMLNPSKAGAVESDPTVTRQVERAKRLGMGGLLVANAFDLVATYPGDLKRHSKPLSDDNDAAILSACERTIGSGGMVVAAWGPHAKINSRHEQMLMLLNGVDLHAVTVTKEGYPGHPLYIGYDVVPFKYEGKK